MEFSEFVKKQDHNKMFQEQTESMLDLKLQVERDKLAFVDRFSKPYQPAP